MFPPMLKSGRELQNCKLLRFRSIRNRFLWRDSQPRLGFHPHCSSQLAKKSKELRHFYLDGFRTSMKSWSEWRGLERALKKGKDGLRPQRAGEDWPKDEKNI